MALFSDWGYRYPVSVQVGAISREHYFSIAPMVVSESEKIFGNDDFLDFTVQFLVQKVSGRCRTITFVVLKHSRGLLKV